MTIQVHDDKPKTTIGEGNALAYNDLRRKSFSKKLAKNNVEEQYVKSNQRGVKG